MNQQYKASARFLCFKLATSPARKLELSVLIMKHNLVPGPLLGNG